MTVAFIPARGGSKGLPGKNIRLLAGRPLIAHSIRTAKSVAGIDRIIVSTDSEEIAAVAKSYGAEVPFVRPANLATDLTPGIAPVLHCLDLIDDIETLVLLQPTSPLRSPHDVTDCLDLYKQTGCSVVSIVEAQNHPEWMYRYASNATLSRYVESHATRRQDLEKVFCLNGAVYVASANQLRNERSFLNASTKGFIMPRERSIDIDSIIDFEIAEFLAHRLGVLQD